MSYGSSPRERLSVDRDIRVIWTDCAPGHLSSSYRITSSELRGRAAGQGCLRQGPNLYQNLYSPLADRRAAKMPHQPQIITKIALGKQLTPPVEDQGRVQNSRILRQPEQASSAWGGILGVGQLFGTKRFFQCVLKIKNRKRSSSE